MTTAVELIDVSKSFKSNQVLREVSLAVSFGQAVAIVGGNGQGKSVLFKIAAGLVAATSGLVVYGDEVTEGGRRPSSIGMLINGPGLVASQSGPENLRFLASSRRSLKKAT